MASLRKFESMKSIFLLTDDEGLREFAATLTEPGIETSAIIWDANLSFNDVFLKNRIEMVILDFSPLNVRALVPHLQLIMLRLQEAAHPLCLFVIYLAEENRERDTELLKGEIKNPIFLSCDSGSKSILKNRVLLWSLAKAAHDRRDSDMPTIAISFSKS